MNILMSLRGHESVQCFFIKPKEDMPKDLDWPKAHLPKFWIRVVLQRIKVAAHGALVEEGVLGV